MSSSGSHKGKESSNCLQCRHFYITWDARYPRGCRAMGFKGQEMPSKMVERASGHACLMFERKKDPSGTSD